MSGPADIASRWKSVKSAARSGWHEQRRRVLAVLEKQEPSPEEVKQTWDTAKETLLKQKRQELEGLYVQNLRDRLEKEGKIKINKKEMERLSRSSEGS